MKGKGGKMTKKVVAFDLETIADPACLAFLPKVKANGGLKDPVKIKADIEKKEEKQIAEMGMNPLLNLIVCAGLYDGKNEPLGISITEATHEAEKGLLTKLWEVLSNYDHFVTFNGRSFDLRCMHIHGMLHGLMPSVNIDKGKYNRGNHTDLRQILAGSEDFAKGQLGFFTQKFLGVDKPEGISGDMIQDYFDNGLHDDIEKYCKNFDAEKTFRLYKMAEKAGLLE